MGGNLFSKYNGNYFSRILSIFLILIMLVLSIAAVSATTDFYVNPNTGDDTQDGLTSASAVRTINQAVNGGPSMSANEDVIHLANGDYIQSAQVNVNHDLTFIGGSYNGTTLIMQSGSQERFFNVNPGVTVTFINITFLNGGNGAHLQGGAIHNEKGSITVRDCIFENNVVYIRSGSELDNSGGAIWNNGTMHIDNCVFINNHAGVSAGAVYSDHGDNVIIENSRFIGNTARHGGAVDVVNGDYFSIINCTFERNRATSSGSHGGGAINIHGYEYDPTSPADSIDGCNFFKIIDCTFIDNYSEGNGGAISNDGNYTTVENCNFTDSIALANGGAIYNSGDNMEVLSSNFTGNTANKGGSLFNDGGMFVKGNLMSGNVATAPEGGNMIYNNGNMGGLFLTYINGDSVKVNDGDDVLLYATLTDDKGNNVTWQNVSFTVKGEPVGSFNCIEGIIKDIPYHVVGNPGDILPVTGVYLGNNSHADFRAYSITIIPGELYIPGPEPPEPPAPPEPPGPEPSEPEPLDPVLPGPDVDPNDPNDPNDPEDIDETSKNPKVKAAMKKTGMPIVAIMLLSLFIIGFGVYRKQ